MPRVFINYRHTDSKKVAHRIADSLANHFGPDEVFVDVHSLRGGQDFRQEIRRTLSNVDALVAIIGPNWLTATTNDGSQRRLDDPSDLVREEIGLALEAGLLVIPTLVDGAAVPAKEDLPAQIVNLPDRNAQEVPERFFPEAMQKLIAAIEQPSPSQRVPGLAVFIGPDDGTLSRGWEMFMPHPPGLVELSDEFRGWEAGRRWVTEHGGMDYGSSRLRVDLVGTGPHAVQVRSIRANVLDRSERAPGAHVISESAGELNTIPCVIDLDGDGIGRRDVTERDPYGIGDVFNDNFVAGPPLLLTVAAGEMVPIQIVARADQFICEWLLELDLVVQGESRVLSLPADGTPFKTAPRTDLDEAYRWGWYCWPLLIGPAEAVCEAGTMAPPTLGTGGERTLRKRLMDRIPRLMRRR